LLKWEAYSEMNLLKRNIKVNLFFSIMILILYSCSVKKDYLMAINFNTIQTYQTFQTIHPKSKYNQDVENRLLKLYDLREWKKSILQNTLYSYENYLRNYPNGDYVIQARDRIEELKKEIEIDNAWLRAKNENSISGFKTFLTLYPNSRYGYNAKSYIKNLEEEIAWKLALEKNSIESYAIYMNSYPNGKFDSIAKASIEKRREEKYVLPIWNETILKNSYKSYLDFFEKYPNSSYAKAAEEKMKSIENKDWDNTRRFNTIKSYTDYMKKYPNGEHFKSAEKAIIDIEVDNIFMGEYSALPPMSKGSSGKSYNYSLNSIDVTNNTQYILTIRYSGPESKKIVLLPNDNTSITLLNGTYKIAASVNASNVSNYAGTEHLTGGQFSSEYYIQTYKKWGY
jgi:outer membrane protein assembly factor BamD (BamD/ComL family)